MEILARFTHSQINHAQDNDIHLVVSLKAPTLDWMEKRPKLCVLPVIDLSGSMGGSKLDYAKRSLLKLVDQLAEGDFAGLVGFENRAHVLESPQQVTAEFKDRLKKTIRNLHTMGGTNFAEGLLQAVKLVEQLDLPASFLKRIIMFTDGQPTTGVTNTKDILKLLEANRGTATVSSFGYGEAGGGVWGGCDQDFLTELATLGKGNYAYVKDPDDALSAFGKELGGLLSTYATDLELEIEPVKGHQVAEVVTNVKHEEDVTGLVEIPISDILSEETRHFVFKTKLAKQAKVFPRDTTAFNVKLSYSVLTEDGSKETRTTEAKARVRFVREADAQTEGDREVEEVVALHQVIRAQLKAEEAAKKGEFDQASKFMEEIAEQAQTSGYVNVAAMANNVRRRVGNQALYAQSAGFLRSVANAGTRAYGTSGMDREAAVFLADCNVALNNDAMHHYEASFVAEEPEPEPPVNLAPAPMTPNITPGGLIIPSGLSQNGLQWVHNQPATGGALQVTTHGLEGASTAAPSWTTSSTDKSE